MQHLRDSPQNIANKRVTGVLTPLDAPFTQNTGVGPAGPTLLLGIRLSISIENPGLVGTVSLLYPALLRISGHGSRPAILPS